MIELFWALVCLAAAGVFWGYAFVKVDNAFIKSGQGQWFAIMFLLVINVSHFLWGFFHTSEDLAEAMSQADRGPFMISPWMWDRIAIRITAFLTIGFSAYLQRAVAWMKVESE